jgi:hypothetical protein
VLVPGGQAVRAVRRHGLHEGRVRVSPRRRYVRRVDRLVPNRQAHQVGDCRRSPVLTASKRRSDNHLLRRHGRQAASSVWAAASSSSHHPAIPAGRAFLGHFGRWRSTSSPS